MKKRILILAVLLAVFTSSAFAVSINVKGNEYKSSPSTSRVGLGLQVGYPLLDAVITYTNTNPLIRKTIFSDLDFQVHSVSTLPEYLTLMQLQIGFSISCILQILIQKRLKTVFSILS